MPAHPSGNGRGMVGASKSIAYHAELGLAGIILIFEFR